MVYKPPKFVSDMWLPGMTLLCQYSVPVYFALFVPWVGCGLSVILFSWTGQYVGAKHILSWMDVYFLPWRLTKMLDTLWIRKQRQGTAYWPCTTEVDWLCGHWLCGRKLPFFLLRKKPSPQTKWFSVRKNKFEEWRVVILRHVREGTLEMMPVSCLADGGWAREEWGPRVERVWPCVSTPWAAEGCGEVVAFCRHFPRMWLCWFPLPGVHAATKRICFRKWGGSWCPVSSSKAALGICLEQGDKGRRTCPVSAKEVCGHHWVCSTYLAVSCHVYFNLCQSFLLSCFGLNGSPVHMLCSNTQHLQMWLYLGMGSPQM